MCVEAYFCNSKFCFLISSVLDARNIVLMLSTSVASLTLEWFRPPPASFGKNMFSQYAAMSLNTDSRPKAKPSNLPVNVVPM